MVVAIAFHSTVFVKVVYRPKSVFLDSTHTNPVSGKDCFYRNSGKEVQFDSKNSLRAKSFSWDFGDNTGASVKENPKHRFKLKPKGIIDSFKVQLHTTSRPGCYHDTFKYIILKAVPVVKLDTTIFRICQGDSFLVKPYFKDSGAVLSWEFGDNTLFWGDSVSKVAQLPSGASGKGALTLDIEAVFTAEECTTQLKVNPIAVVHELSQARITLTSLFDDKDHCYPFGRKKMIFSSDSSKNANQVKWDFDGGTVSHDTVQFQLKDSVVQKDFKITLVIRNALGCLARAVRIITIKANPRVSIRKVKTEVCEGDAFCLEPDTLQLYGNYQWRLSDGRIVNGEKMCRKAFIYGEEGVGLEYMDVVLWVEIDSNGCKDSVTEKDLIKIYESPKSRFQMETVNASNNDCYALGKKEIHFNSDSSVNADSVFWHFGDGSSSIETGPRHTYRLDTGSIDSIYQISLVVKNSLKCADSTSQTLRVKRLPAVVFDTLTQLRVCTNSDTCRTPSIWQKEAFYTWAIVHNGQELNRSFGRKFCSDYPSPGPSEVSFLGIKLITELTNGCKDSLFADSLVKSYRYPEVNFEFLRLNNDPDFCYKNGKVDVQFNSSDSRFGKEIYWDFGDGDSSEEVNPAHFYSLDGVLENTYIVKCTMKNQLGCAKESTKPLLVKRSPVVAFDSTRVSVCEESEICFRVGDSAISSTVKSYQWKFQDGVIGGSDSYCRMFETDSKLWKWRDVTLVITSENGCVNSLYRSEHVLVKKKPDAAFKIEDVNKNPLGQAIPHGKIRFNDASISLGDTTEITNLWTLGDGTLVNNVFAFSHRYRSNDEYNVQYILVDTNGCSDTTYLTVEPSFFFGLQVPNALAPEFGIGDGKVFKPKGVGLKNYRLEIYNEQGALLFESRELDPMDGSPLEGWDGIVDSEYASQGVYFWRIFAVFENGQVWPGKLIGDRYCRTGSIMLMR